MSDATTVLRPTWTRWGADEQRRKLPASVQRLLLAELGPGVETATESTTPPALPQSRLTADDAAHLAAVAGSVRTDDAARAAATGGMSYLDLLERRAGRADSCPDAVVLPDSPGEVVAVLELAAERSLAVVPLGGGTSVVGGLDLRHSERPVIALATHRLNRLIGVDAISHTATVQAGMRGPDLEAALAEHGFTVGHAPQSFEFSTVGGWVAARGAGQASSGYGRVDGMLVGARVATPRGEWVLGRGPASAAGPRLLDLVAGSEGAFGVITEVTLRVRPRPAATADSGWSFASFDDGLAAFRELAQELGHGWLPDVCRLSDDAETRATLLLGSDHRGVRLLKAYVAARGRRPGCLAILAWEGPRIDERRKAAHAILTRHGVVALGKAPGQAWRRGRFEGAFLRDALLDAGYLVETLESAASWAQVPRLRDDVVAALTASLRAEGTEPMVHAHISHLYETGASVYVTVLARRSPSDARGQWLRAKAAATEAALAAGGTLTHHHGVGRDHAGWLPREIGDLGVDVLRAVKQALDPHAVLNPGVLLP